jgi:hypothetical protein
MREAGSSSPSEYFRLIFLLSLFSPAKVAFRFLDFFDPNSITLDIFQAASIS